MGEEGWGGMGGRVGVWCGECGCGRRNGKGEEGGKEGVWSESDPQMCGLTMKFAEKGLGDGDVCVCCVCVYVCVCVCVGVWVG